MLYSEESIEELYENAPFGYVSFLADGEIVRANKTFLDLMGFSRDEVLHLRKIQNFFKIGGKIYFETHFFPLLKMQGFIKEVQFDLVKKNKAVLPALFNVNQLEDPKSGVIIYRASIIDITDRKKYEQVLINEKKRAEETVRAKAEFLSTISHEIRTPLNAIVGIGNLIQNTPLNKKQEQYARILQMSSNNLLDLVNNLLDLSKLEANKTKVEKKTFDLRGQLEVIVNTFKVKAKEKNIQFKTHLSEALPQYLIGDPLKLNQVLTNLIGNSIKFTRAGTVILNIEVLRNDKKQVELEFKVSDTGIGIPTDKLKSIFDEFSQASYDVNMEFGGTGLGLTISQKLLQLQGSELHVDSTEGKGSEFSFTLSYELSSQHAMELVQPKLSEDLGALSGCVLVVDDNDTNLFIISRYLEEWNINFKTVNSGFKAISAVEEQQFDLILMDLHMPKMNGFETTKEIFAKNTIKKPTVIALSASGRGDMDLKLKRAGISAYVPKPFKPQELREVLIHFLRDNNEDASENLKNDHTQIFSQTSVQPEPLKKAGNENKFPRLIKMSKNSDEILEKLCGSFLKSTALYAKEFDLASKASNCEKLAELVHKNATTMHYLEAEQVVEKIERYRKLLSSSTGGESFQNLRMEILNEFYELIENLKKLNATVKNDI